MKKQMLLLAMMLLPVLAWADDSGIAGDGSADYLNRINN